MTAGHNCIIKGCAGLAVYGFGRPSSGIMKWACAEHTGRIWPTFPSPSAGGDAAGGEADGSGERTAPARAIHPSQPPFAAKEQGRLL